ncbi:MAG: hypothetical protein ACRCX2_18555 [Paraclostridium sp.]
MENGSLNINNTLHGLGQTNVWSTYLAPLPISYLAFDKISIHINLPSYKAPQYITPVYDLLDISKAIPQLSSGSVEERVVTPTSTPLVMQLSEHGFTVVLFSNLQIQSPFSVASATCRLMSNGLARLRETLGWLHVSSVASTNIYNCSFGTNTSSPTERTIKDLILAKNMLEQARVEKFNQKLLVATNQISTAGVPHTFAYVMNMQSSADLELILSAQAQNYLRPDQHAGIVEYSEVYKGAIQVANLTLLMSSEIPQIDSTNSMFIDYIIGKNSIYSGKGVFNSGISIRPAEIYAYRRNCSIDCYTTFSVGVITSRMALVKSTPSKRS